MAVASRKVGKYVRKLKLMSRIVNDPDYATHGKDTPIYVDIFLQDEDGNRMEIEGNEYLLTLEEKAALRWYKYGV